MKPSFLARGYSLPFISAVCNILFLLLAPWSLQTLYRSPVKVRPSWQSRVKIVNIVPLNIFRMPRDTDAVT